MVKKIILILTILLIAVLPMWAQRKKPIVPDSLQRIEIKIPIAGRDSYAEKNNSAGIDSYAEGNNSAGIDSYDRGNSYVGKDLYLSMQRVEGGSFMMGATAEQYDPDIYTDKPAHLVFLSPYYIATTEVTVALWRAVMPEREVIDPNGYPNVPISYIAWTDCQEFVRRLDSITGMPFRLPTEAEWEYAARGGKQSKGYRFAGGNEADNVGWTYTNSGNWKHTVGKKQANELGLYDMTGNVSEWCQDRYGTYQLSTLPDPCGPDTGAYRIVRGGSYDACIANSHLSVRNWYLPETSAGYIGLRVAFTLPNDPMMQVQEDEEPPLRQSIRIRGKRIRFDYVPAEQPYYISEEIECRLWKKIMQKEAPDRIKSVAIGMSKADRIRFAEYCSRKVDKALFVASAEQIVAAEQHGIIESFQAEEDHRKKKKKQSIRQIQRKRKIAKKLSPWTELIGIRLPAPDDPILLQYKKADDESRPLRLVIYP
ncbi:MAG: SUMF1/EgtB/PvdO family nonheme iron enzyme [Paludibacteraceae bacterium]|nr:SUMF1/EgtB/PvdO family nonheme iron enzyme [Paludibacteraceae bacterium]